MDAPQPARSTVPTAIHEDPYTQQLIRDNDRLRARVATLEARLERMEEVHRAIARIVADAAGTKTGAHG